MTWYKDWFDSPLYEKIYANRDEAEARKLADFIAHEAPVSSFKSVLDLGCGRGRHALNFAQLGYQVTGVDLSEAAIKKAKMLAQERGLSHVTFLTGDMRLGLPETFDLIVNLFTTFGYFESDKENEKVIQKVAEMLRYEGLFYLDFLNPDWVISHLKKHETGSFEEIHYSITRDVKDNFVTKTMEFELPEGELVTYSEKVRLLDIRWFEAAMAKAGLQLEAVYGDYTGAPYNKKVSPRMLMRAVKATQ